MTRSGGYLRRSSRVSVCSRFCNQRNSSTVTFLDGTIWTLNGNAPESTLTDTLDNSKGKTVTDKFTTDDTLLSILETETDAQGKTTTETKYDTKGNISTITVDKYDAQGRITSETLTKEDTNGLITSTENCTYTYTANGDKLLSSETQTNAKGNTTVIDNKYDDSGKLLSTSKTQMDANGNITNTGITNNANGTSTLLSSFNTQDANGKITATGKENGIVIQLRDRFKYRDAWRWDAQRENLRRAA